MANAKGRTRDVNAAQRATLALQLRTQGQTYEQISHACGYASRGACHDAIQRELGRVVVENVVELRREQLLSLDRLQEMCWKLAGDEDNKGRLFAVDRLLQIFDRRAKLMNLDLRPDEAAAQQNYTKRIVLTHTISTGGDDGSSNS